MGCDVHMAVEVYLDGKWVNVLRDKPVKRYSWETKEWYEGRNYTLFGCLAGVRNNNVPLIAEPRDLPDDMDPRTTAPWRDEDEYDEEKEKKLPSGTTVRPMGIIRPLGFFSLKSLTGLCGKSRKMTSKES
jgi:hypothetical protein